MYVDDMMNVTEVEHQQTVDEALKDHEMVTGPGKIGRLAT